MTEGFSADIGFRTVKTFPANRKIFGGRLCRQVKIAVTGVNQPCNRSGVRQIGGQFGMGMVKKVMLAGQPPYRTGQLRVVNQIIIPHMAVRQSLNLKNAQATLAIRTDMRAQTGFLSGRGQ